MVDYLVIKEFRDEGNKLYETFKGKFKKFDLKFGSKEKPKPLELKVLMYVEADTVSGHKWYYTEINKFELETNFLQIIIIHIFTFEYRILSFSVRNPNRFWSILLYKS